MRRLLALALACVAASTAPVAADPLRFERECKGRVDAACTDQFCGIVSCVTRDCVVFLDPSPGYNTGICVGKARPGDPIES